MSKSNKNLERRVVLQFGGAFVASTAVAACTGLPKPETLGLAVSQKTGDVREFDFTTSTFSGDPDGRERELWGYNGVFPGPEIRVKEGDTIRVKVNNQLPAPTSIHWHGMKQRDTWTMDGVTPISRQPIPIGESFIYEFTAEPAGTHWYHSHTGVQYSEGLLGALIVESKDDNYDYDRDQVLMIGDWFVESGDVIFENIKSGTYRAAEKPTLGAPKPDYGDVPFESFVFNGVGQMPDKSSGAPNTFMVKKGETIRFRIINTSSTYTFKMQFGGHEVTIIEADGQPVAPMKADSLTIDIGERVDVLLRANQDGTHVIRASTLDGQQGVAILQYENDPITALEVMASTAAWGNTVVTSSDLRASETVNVPATGHRSVDLKFKGSRKPYAWPINGKSYPDGPPVMVKRGESIRFVMNNPTGMSHPFHLHGHYFRVLGRPGSLNLKNPPLRDSVTVPPNDTVVIQFDTDNPGNWFFHCHIEWHLGIGMGLEIKYSDL